MHFSLNKWNMGIVCRFWNILLSNSSSLFDDFFFYFFLSVRVLGSPSWSLTPYAAEDGFESGDCLHLLNAGITGVHLQTWFMTLVLGMEPRAECMWGKQSTNWGTPTGQLFDALLNKLNEQTLFDANKDLEWSSLRLVQGLPGLSLWLSGAFIPGCVELGGYSWECDLTPWEMCPFLKNQALASQQHSLSKCPTQTVNITVAKSSPVSQHYTFVIKEPHTQACHKYLVYVDLAWPPRETAGKKYLISVLGKRTIEWRESLNVASERLCFPENEIILL